ncbi:MAG TPA: hypothetical protein PKV71_09490 [Calditrichia bacterium]|nr:hypothetical protein [Calditrichia bacterium]
MKKLSFLPARPGFILRFGSLLGIIALICQSCLVGTEPPRWSYHEEYRLAILNLNTHSVAHFPEQQIYGPLSMAFMAGDSIINILTEYGIYSVKANGTGLRTILRFSREISDPGENAFSSDGTALTFSASKGSSREIFVYDFLADTLEQITDTPEVFERYPSFSHSKRRIAFTVWGYAPDNRNYVDQAVAVYDRVSQNQIEFIRYNPDNGRNNFVQFFYPAFSWDDQKLIYIKFRYEVPGHDLMAFDFRNHVITKLDSMVSDRSRLWTSPQRDVILYTKIANPGYLTTITSTGEAFQIVAGISPSYRSQYTLSPNTQLVSYSIRPLTWCRIDGTQAHYLEWGKAPAFSFDGNSMVFLEGEEVLD